MIMKRALFAFSVLALTACGQTATVTPDRPGDAPAPVEVTQSTDGECLVMTGEGPPIALESHGTAAGYAIAAAPGVLACSEPGLEGAVECAATGPGQISVSGPSTTNYSLGPGQTATLVVGPSGPQCHLNANGE
jgi:hypothetical protein